MFSELLFEQCVSDLFTSECHSKSELLGPCLAGPLELFIELYDNSAARPGPAWATLIEGQTTVLAFFELFKIITAFTKIHFLDL